MSIPGNFIQPDREFVLTLVGRAVFQDADENILDQVLADASVAGETETKVIDHHMIPLKQDCQFLNISISDLEHQLVVRCLIHGCISSISVISLIKT